MVYKISPSGGSAKNGTRCAALLGDEDVLSFRGSCFILLSSIVINLCFTFRWCSKALLRNSNKGHKTFCYNRLKSKIKILFFFFFSLFIFSFVCSSAFFLFCSEFRPKIKGEHPGLSIGDVAKKLGEMWNNTAADDKQPYEKKAAKLKEKYEKVTLAFMEVVWGEQTSIFRYFPILTCS